MYVLSFRRKYLEVRLGAVHVALLAAHSDIKKSEFFNARHPSKLLAADPVTLIFIARLHAAYIITSCARSKCISPVGARTVLNFIYLAGHVIQISDSNCQPNAQRANHNIRYKQNQTNANSAFPAFVVDASHCDT